MWQGYQRDYDITRPTKIKLVNRDVEENTLPMPKTDKNALVGYIMTDNKKFYLQTGRPYETWYVQKYDLWKCQQYNKMTPYEKETDTRARVKRFLCESDTQFYAKSADDTELALLKQLMTLSNKPNHIVKMDLRSTLLQLRFQKFQAIRLLLIKLVVLQLFHTDY